MHIIVPDVYTEVYTEVMSGGTLIPEKIDWEKSAYGTTVAEIFKEAPCPAELSTYTSTAHRSSAAYGSKTLYESWVDYGNMLGTYYGHDHKNSFVSTTDDGIDIGYGKAPTLESYNDDNPGCRIYELDASGTYTTFNVTESDLAKTAVNFDANGGSGYMLGQLITKSTTAALNANTFTRPGYGFEGWATSATGSVVYTDGTNITVGTSDIKLYAKWSQITYINITFDANGGNGGTGPTAMIFGTPLTAPTVSKTGYTFNGWQPFVPPYVLAPDTTFAAQWLANNYTVNYDANGGTGSVASSSHTYDVPKALTNNGYMKTGCSFAGWATSPDGPAAFLDGQVVTNLSTNPGTVVTLYAAWKVSPELTAQAGSMTVINNSNSFIYGLEPGITQADFINGFVAVNGNARLVFSPGYVGFGTGAIVNLVDNITDEVLFTYSIVIFGDVNGDGSVDSLDAGVMVDVENYLVNWDDPAFAVFRLAGDLNGDGSVDSLDAGVMVDFENYLLSIDQAAGTVV